MLLEYDSDNKSYYIQLGGRKIVLDKNEIDEGTKEKAVMELRETPDNVSRGLYELRKMVEEDGDFCMPSEVDEYLTKFLRPCKFYSNSAYDLLKRFNAFKKKYPQYSENLSFATVKKAFDQNLFKFQETRDSNGCRIIVIDAGAKWNPNEFSIDEMFQAAQVALEAILIEPATQVNGIVVMFNLLGFSLSHALHITPSFAKMVVEWIQDCIPIRLKGIHIVNQPYIFNMVFALFRPFLSQKLKNRMHFHGSNYAKYITLD